MSVEPEMGLLPSDKVKWEEIDEETRAMFFSDGRPYEHFRYASVGERRPPEGRRARRAREAAFREWRDGIEKFLQQRAPADWRDEATRWFSDQEMLNELSYDEETESYRYCGTLLHFLRKGPPRHGRRAALEAARARRRAGRPPDEWNVVDDALVLANGDGTYEEVWAAKERARELHEALNANRQQEKALLTVVEHLRKQAALLERRVFEAIPTETVTRLYFDRSLKVSEVARFFGVTRSMVASASAWEHTEAVCPMCSLYYVVTANTRAEQTRLLANPPCGCYVEGQDRDVADVTSCYVATEPRAGNLSVLELRNLARRDYEAYLKTEHWQETRRAAHEHHGSACGRCCSTQRLDVHHVTYDRLGHERLEDLEILCRVCHERHHERDSRPVPVTGATGQPEGG